METVSALLAICAGNSPVPVEFLAQRPVTRSFDVFPDLHLNKLLSKQSWGSWFETLSRPLWRHRNEYPNTAIKESNLSHNLYLYYNYDLLQQFQTILSIYIAVTLSASPASWDQHKKHCKHMHSNHSLQLSISQISNKSFINNSTYNAPFGGICGTTIMYLPQTK